MHHYAKQLTETHMTCFEQQQFYEGNSQEKKKFLSIFDSLRKRTGRLIKDNITSKCKALTAW